MRKLILLSVLATACGDFQPTAENASDIARLTVLDVAAIVQLLDADESCGFKSPAAIAGQIIDGEPGAEGTVTRTVEDCAIDLDTRPWPYFVCDQNAGVARGKARVWARRTIGGRVTDEVDRPVVPGGPDAMTIELTRVDFENLAIERRDEAASLAIARGSLSAFAKVRLAASTKERFCEVATPHARFGGIKYLGAEVILKDVLRERAYAVETSELLAVNGLHGDKENTISGDLTVNGTTFTLSSTATLDKTYDRTAFEADYACPAQPGLAMPATFECDGVGDLLAQNTSRLGVLALGKIVDILEEDTRCGFASPAVESAAGADVAPGGVGTLTYAVENCTIELTAGSTLAADCLGHSDRAEGKITVTARKTIYGRITGDPQDPVIPLSDAGVLFAITGANFEEFKIHHGTRSILIHSGSLSGLMRPRLALDTDDQACAFRTDIARFEHVAFGGARVRVETVSGAYEAIADSSDLTAVAGAWNGAENALQGTILLNGKSFTVPTDPADAELDPDYDAASFDAAWQCGPTLARPVSFDCPFVQPLVESSARLSLNAMAAITKLIEKEASCGFASATVLAAAQVGGAPGDGGATGVFSLAEGCELEYAQPTAVDVDCNGRSTWFQGKLVVRGTKTLTGYNTGDASEPVIPTARDPATFELSAELTDFSFWEEARPGDRFSVGSATLSGTMRPRLALDLDTLACKRITPILTMERVAYSAPANLALVLDGKRFDVTVAEAELFAQSGDKDGVRNEYAGRITVDGRSHSLPIDGDDALDPDYDQATFDAGYQACEPLLRPAAGELECDYKEAIAREAARQIVKSTSALIRMVNYEEDDGDNKCKFTDMDNLEEEALIVGEEGHLGAVGWTAPAPGEGPICRYRRAATHVVREDCLGRRIFMGGDITLDAHRIVQGIREDKGPVDYVNPLSPDAPTAFQFNNVSFSNWSVFELDPGARKATESLVLSSGTMTAALNPILAEDEDDDFTFLVATPIARFNDITVTGGPMTIVFDGKTFKAILDSAQLTAFSGTYNGDSNRVGGTVVIDGRTVSVPTQALDPDYNQADFDARYFRRGHDCSDDIAYPVPVQFP